MIILFLFLKNSKSFRPNHLNFIELNGFALSFINLEIGP